MDIAFYAPMKAPDHPVASGDRRMANLLIEGLATTKPLFEALLSDPDVRANRVHTKWLEPWLETHDISTEGQAA